MTKQITIYGTITRAGTQPAPPRIEWRDGQWYYIETLPWSAATGATLRVGDSDEIRMEKTQDAPTMTEPLYNWQSIDSAPRDGTPILARAKNAVGRWTEPCVVWWGENGGWECGPDDDGQPMIVYHPLLEWVPITHMSSGYHTYKKAGT